MHVIFKKCSVEGVIRWWWWWKGARKIQNNYGSESSVDNDGLHTEKATQVEPVSW